MTTPVITTLVAIDWDWLAARTAAAGFVAVTAIVLVMAGSIYRRRRARRIRSWRDAEAATARWLRKAGCRRVRLTRAGADGGIDVLTSDWAVQVKHTTKRVGRPAVQQLVGAALTLGLRPALFSTSGFSSPAVAYAGEHDVALFELTPRGRARRLNASARKLGRGFRRERAAWP